MPIKRALVVDDSRSARVALKNLLEDNDLDVALAESGEAALEYLKKNLVDVVFMDHTMPGMDGLEAVSAIKANPKTATIPVMMYTAKEGEVYVGQARALGALGVMPKNVQPHQLFEMLAKLGLVHDRRAQPVAESAETTDHASSSQTDTDDSAADTVDDPASSDQSVPATVDDDRVERQLEEQAQGMSLKNLLTRILEDQHVVLRSDILRGNKDFAREVAREIMVEQTRMEADREVDTDLQADDNPIDTVPDNNWWWRAAAVVLIGIGALLTWQFKVQRDDAIAQLESAQSSIRDTQASASVRLQQELAAADGEISGLQSHALAALEWSLNTNNTAAADEDAFNDALAEKIDQLIIHLQQMDFVGQVRLISHLGQFCLMADSSGAYQVAPPEYSVLDCDHQGHRLEASSYVSDRLSVDFSRLMRGPISDKIELNLVALDAVNSQPVVEYPPPDVSAGEWNAVALLNNRVQIDLIPEN